MSLFTSIARSGRPDDDAGPSDADAPDFAAPPPPGPISIEQLASQIEELREVAASERAARLELEDRLAELAGGVESPGGGGDVGHDDAFTRIQKATDDITALVERVEDERAELRARLDRVDRRRNEAVERLDVIEARLDDDTSRPASTHSAPPSVPTESAPTIAQPATANTAAVADDEGLEELNDRISGALGQTELLRIEMDRFVETVSDKIDTTTARVTAVETTVQEQYQDVETAAQLERLEEVERMVLMLDPSGADTRVVPVPEPSLIGDVGDTTSTATTSDVELDTDERPSDDDAGVEASLSTDADHGDAAVTEHGADETAPAEPDEDDSVEALLAAYKGPPGKRPTPPPSRTGPNGSSAAGQPGSTDTASTPTAGVPTLPPS